MQSSRKLEWIALKEMINRIQHNSDQVSYYINGWRNV